MVIVVGRLMNESKTSTVIQDSGYGSLDYD